MSDGDHELVKAFADRGVHLNGTLTEMLNEHFTHRTERRGCGYTQSTRHLAVLVNRPREKQRDTIASLFPEWVRGGGLSAGVMPLHELVLSIRDALEREESRLLASLIADLVLPATVTPGVEELPAFFGEIKVGTCPLTEKYFLEVGDGLVRRKGRINVLVSATGAPLLVEKLGLGDNHSCISVSELIINGVRCPPGSLFGVEAAPEGLALRPNRTLPGSVIPVARCTGFRFLRFATLAVSPEHRQRAFTTHFQSQLDAGLFAPGNTTVAQLRRVAEAQL